MSSTAASLQERFPSLARLEGLRRRSEIPFVPQTTVVDCGAACLAMVLAHHGRRATLEEVRARMDLGRDGLSMRNLLDAGESFGLRGRAVRLEPEDLEMVPPGTILHWRMNHFVVLEGLTTGGARILDPATGRRRVSAEEIGRSLTGAALLFEPSAEFETAAPGRSRVWEYLRTVLTQSHTLLRILAASVLAQVLALAFPLLTGAVVDKVIPRGDQALLGVIAAGIALVVAFDFILNYTRSLLFLHLRTNLDLRMSLDFVDHLLRLPFPFFQVRQTGDLVMRLNSNAAIREILTSSALSAILDGSMVAVYLLILMLLHPGLGLLVLFLGVLRVVVYALSRRRYRELMTESLQAQAESSSYQVQMLEGIESLKAGGAEARAVERWSHLLTDVMNASIRRGRLSALVDALLGALGVASPLVLLAFGAWLVLRGDLTLGTMLAMGALATGFLRPLSQLVNVALQLQTLGSYVDRVDDVLAEAPEQADEAVTESPMLTGDIELRDVSFRYSEASAWAVAEVSVTIPAGSQVAVVGPSGSGKSTLVRLLVGLQHPDRGEILFDGRRMRGLELGSLRRQIGFVPQNPFLFSGTIRENIVLAHPDASLDQVDEAARRASVDGFIDALPLGYDTPVSEGGSSLAGGQRQRIALARALLGDPAILVLDEATSHLDTLTERSIQAELRALSCTRIVIAHRLSTVVDADLILVMDGGRIVDSGTHRELLARGGLYRNLVRGQLQGDEG